MKHSQSLMLIAIATFSALSAVGQSTATTRVTSLLPLGLGTTETARVYLTNIATASTSGTVASCDGSVSFLNAAGATIGVATTFKIATQQTTAVSLPFSGAGLTGSHGVIRTLISVTRPASTTATPAPPCSLLVAEETFETVSGATHLYFTDQIAVSGFGGGNGH